LAEFFCARNAVIELQKYQNRLGENRRPPYFFTNQKRDYGSVKLQMFRKRPLIYINSKVPFDESLPPLPSRRFGVPDHSNQRFTTNTN
jgi:hypothetical protein